MIVAKKLKTGYRKIYSDSNYQIQDLKTLHVYSEAIVKEYIADNWKELVEE